MEIIWIVSRLGRSQKLRKNYLSIHQVHFCISQHTQIVLHIKHLKSKYFDQSERSFSTTTWYLTLNLHGRFTVFINYYRGIQDPPLPSLPERNRCSFSLGLAPNLFPLTKEVLSHPSVTDLREPMHDMDKYVLCISPMHDSLIRA